MQPQPKEKHKRSKNDGKRSVFADKRYATLIQTLPLPGKIYYHVLVVSLYIGYELIVSKGVGYLYSFAVYIPFYLLFIIVFYSNAHILYPTLHLHRKPMWKPCLFLLLQNTFVITILLAINHLLRYFLTGELSFRTHQQTLINSTWRSIFLIVVSAAYWLYLHMLAQKRREIQMLKHQREAERREYILQIAYDNARMNPHFLFNTLQYIHREVEQVAPKAELAISGLSDMIRYSFAPLSEDGMVSLNDELAQVERFITLNRQLNGNRFNLAYSKNVDDEALGLKIPPHMLLAIAENIVKHGVLHDPVKAAYLHISCEGTTLEVVAQNHKPPHAKPKGSGLGMSSLRSRLRYLYPDKHTLDIDNNAAYYHLKLTILL